MAYFHFFLTNCSYCIPQNVPGASDKYFYLKHYQNLTMLAIFLIFPLGKLVKDQINFPGIADLGIGFEN